MEDELIPGDLTSDPTDPFFANSMAEKIEQQLDNFDGGGRPAAPQHGCFRSDRARPAAVVRRHRARRRLHLAQHPGAFIRDDASIAFPLTRINHA